MAIVRTYRVQDTPPPFLNLAWHIFFSSRGRGVSMDAHFPWLKAGGRDDRTWCIEEMGQPAAMLVMRKGVIQDEEGAAIDFHAIGLVCTAPAFGKRGFASRLVEVALKSAGDGTPVLLWTSQHDFYARFGFQLIDPTLMVACEFANGSQTAAVERTDWQREERYSACFGGPRGLPAFVEGAQRTWSWVHPKASFILSTGHIPSMLDMDAPTETAAEAIAALGIERMVLNMPRETPLLAALKERGARVVPRPTDIAMWRPGRFDPLMIGRWDIPLLDRF